MTNRHRSTASSFRGCSSPARCQLFEKHCSLPPPHTIQSPMENEAMQSCAALTHLTLRGGITSADDLAAFVPSLPLLENLEISSVELSSLDFLARLPHLQSTRKELALRLCNLQPFGIRHLQCLCALERLTLTRCFAEVLDECTLAMMTPGSETFARDCWPNLSEMEYAPKRGQR
jgi:hypothetical protein